MEKVAVLGVGMTRFGKQPTRAIEDIGLEAVRNALADSGLDRIQIEEAFCGSSYGGPLIGQRVLRDLGMTRIPITNIENACSSSASALREACSAVACGRAETVLVFGVEKLSAFGGGTLPLEATDLEVGEGLAMPAVYAMRARRYLAENDATPEHLARISVKARSNGALNRYAQFQQPVTVDEVLRSRMIADPLTLYMCCPTGDGAAAAVVSSIKKAKELRPKPISIVASALQSGEYKTGYRDMGFSELTRRTVSIAYAQAGVGPEDLSLAELHDAFAIAEVMYYEALGFCGRGEAKYLVEREETSIGGRIPVNTSGGLLSRGHPVGATGLAQVCEATWQLRGEAGDRQVEGAKVALTHCTGGGISGLDHGACCIHILTA